MKTKRSDRWKARTAARALFTCSLFHLFTAAASAGDWPNFRGPKHDGVSPETGLKTTWTTPLKMVWQREVGSGFSGISCVGDRAYTCGTRDEKQVAVCLNADTGDVLWQTPIEASYFEGQGGSGPRSTPAVDDGRVYVLGAEGRFVCLNATDGKVLWDKKFGGKPQWGFSGSALVEGNMVVVSAGGKHGALVAYDKKTGSELWKAGDDPVGYATPYPFTFEGGRYICGFTGNSALLVRAADGVSVLRIPWETDFSVNAASPIFHDGFLLISSGYHTGSALFKLRRDGEKLKADKVWGVDKVLMAKFQSAVLYEGHLYCSDQKRLACVDFATGKEKWSAAKIKDSTLVIAQGHLFVQQEDGTLLIAPADPAGFKPTTRASVLNELCWTVPTLHKGRIYTRNLANVKCFQLTE